jgi:transcriptional regulator with XRE-family HTH domain
LEHTCQNQHENETIAERLLIVRRRTGLSQSDFAKSVHVIPRSYRNYEAAVRDVPLALAINVHRKFDVDLSWLLLGEAPSVTLPAPAVYKKIFLAMEDFQETRVVKFSAEKKAKLISFLVGQFASGREMTDAEIFEYLETTV